MADEKTPGRSQWLKQKACIFGASLQNVIPTNVCSCLNLTKEFFCSTKMISVFTSVLTNVQHLKSIVTYHLLPTIRADGTVPPRPLILVDKLTLYQSWGGRLYPFLLSICTGILGFFDILQFEISSLIFFLVWTGKKFQFEIPS